MGKGKENKKMARQRDETTVIKVIKEANCVTEDCVALMTSMKLTQ